mgnify:CR=1 FL=1
MATRKPKPKPKFRVGMKAVLMDTGRIVELIGKDAPDLFVWRSLEHTAIGTVPRHLLGSLTRREASR